MFQTLGDRIAAPFLGRLFRRRILPAIAFGQIDQPFGRVVALVEDHILAGLAQLRLDIIIDVELTGIDDGHVQACGNGVVEKHAVHRAAHDFVAAEGKAEVREAAREMHMRAALREVAHRLDEIDGITAMLVDAGGDGEHIGIEDDVFRRETVLGQHFIGALANLDLAFLRIGLALFIERHDHGGGAISAAFACGLQEQRLAFLHRDGIDDRLAGHAFQPGLDHLPFGAVDHHRNPGDVGLGGDQLQKGGHRLDRIEQAFVHVHIDDLRAILHLIAGHLDSGLVIAVQDQLLKARRPGDVGALADIDEIGGGVGLGHKAFRISFSNVRSPRAKARGLFW